MNQRVLACRNATMELQPQHFAKLPRMVLNLDISWLTLRSNWIDRSALMSPDCLLFILIEAGSGQPWLVWDSPSLHHLPGPDGVCFAGLLSVFMYFLSFDFVFSCFFSPLPIMSKSILLIRTVAKVTFLCPWPLPLLCPSKPAMSL